MLKFTDFCCIFLMLVSIEPDLESHAQRTEIMWVEI